MVEEAGFPQYTQLLMIERGTYKMNAKISKEMGQRMWSLMLALVLIISPLATTKAYATDCLTYNTLDDIEENLDIFKTISKGSISAINIDGIWYYQFARSGYSTVRIRASAFSTSPNNFYLQADNAALTRTSNDNNSRICYYNSMESQSGVHYDTYTTSMYRFKLEVQGKTDDEIILRTELTHYVTFTYSTKVKRISGDFEAGLPSGAFTDFYVTPSTRMLYESALQRTSNVKEITPTMTLEVTNTGDNAICLSTYTLCGKGKSSTSLNVNDYIRVAAAVESVIEKATRPTIGTLEALVDLIGNVKTALIKDSKGYNTGRSEMLSKSGNNPVLQVEYVSPVALINKGDWVQVTTKLNSSKFRTNLNGTDAQFKVTFSF